MALTADDKAWIENLLDRRFKSFFELISTSMNEKLSRLGTLLANRIPHGIKYNLLVAFLGFALAAFVMDIKNMNIKHVSYPLKQLEQMLVEGAGMIAVYTGGYLADYNRMYPSQTTTQLIIGLTNTQARSFMAAMRMRESSNDYLTINAFGYSGAYGMGAAALADINYLDRAKYNRAPDSVKLGTNKAEHLGYLQDASNWTRYSFEEFMANSDVQDMAFVAFANKNIERGFKNGALKRGDHKRLAGYAAAAHLVGPNKAFLYYGSNMNSEDRYGSTAGEYAKLGEDSIKGPAPRDVGVIPSGFPMDARYYINVSSGFGNRWINGHRGFHGGIDFPVPVGTPVTATADGKVILAGDLDKSCGYGVKVLHNDNYSTVVCHLSRINVRTGQWVRRGGKLGESGGMPGATGSGRSTGPHIHYAVKYNGKAIDPMGFIPQLSVKKGFAIRPQQMRIPAREALK